MVSPKTFFNHELFDALRHENRQNVVFNFTDIY